MASLLGREERQDCPLPRVHTHSSPPKLEQGPEAWGRTVGSWGYRHLERPGFLSLLEVSRIPGTTECASSILPTACEDQKLGQWDDFARHASPQSQIGEKSGLQEDPPLPKLVKLWGPFVD